MRTKSVLLPLLFIFFARSQAQQVDLVRLGYDERTLQSEQVGMAVSGDGRYIAFVYKDRIVRIFDNETGRFIKRFKIEFTGEFLGLKLLGDKLILVLDNEMRFVSWKNESTIKSVSYPIEQRPTRLSFLPKRSPLALGTANGTINVWDIDKLELITSITTDKGSGNLGILQLSFKMDGKSLIGCNSFSGKLISYEIPSGRVLAEYNGKDLPWLSIYDDVGREILVMYQQGLQAFNSLKIIDGQTLRSMREFGKLETTNKSDFPTGGVYYKEKWMIPTLSHSFNVYNNSGNLIFTTKPDDKYILPFFGGRTKIYKSYQKSLSPLIYELGNGKFLINASGNNINQIYDANSNKVIGYIYTDSNDDFAVVSRDGRVDGTQSSLSKVYWTARKSEKKTSLDSRYEKGFTPRLLADLIGNVSSSQVADFNVDDAIDKAPVLSIKAINNSPLNPTGSISLTQKAISIDVDVTQNPNEISEVRLFQNGKLQKVKPNEGKTTYHFDAQLTVSFGEENYFFVSAQSKGGTESEKVKFSVTYKGASEDKPRMFLLTIGVNQYRNPKYSLNYAQADADAVQNNLKPAAEGLFKEVIVTEIRNDQATKDNIIQALTTIQQNALEQDVLVVYYAGHGVMNGAAAEDRDFYIVPYDVTQLYGKDEMLKEKAISASELKKFAQTINAQKQVFILDACQSAGALEALAQRGAAEEKAIAQLARSTGSFWITATGTDQFATEFEKLGHGVFTYALLEGISGKADTNGDKKLTIKELSTYVENRVPEVSEQYKGSPQFPSAYSFGNDFPIVIYKP